MNQEEFIKSYKEQSDHITSLKNQLHAAEKELDKIQSEYFATLPWKVGDCVRITQAKDFIEKGWISEIKVFDFAPDEICLCVRQPKNDGTINRRRVPKRFFNVQPDEVEILERK